ncbi:Terminal deoxycytidyl transferase rev1 [Nesidiocoris tenuis]|uniref:DNA repair protein REV1 n=1 Tax=Nesidiocoris tenuis TaxID=355587 RepID=A0ABN7A8T1_9HEMI|nr:Terminal deoxycytidyl transferase rev1 [Nesidiocoris tenuis]
MKRRKRERNENGFEDWGGYMNAKKAKLSEQFKVESAKAGLKVDDLFKGVKIFVNGYTDPSADELRILMMQHGGEYHHYYRTGNTTHVIATNLPDSKLSQTRTSITVKPEWIVKSIEANKLLNYKDYLLVTGRTISQPPLLFTKQQSNKSPTKLPMKNTADDHFIDEFYANSRLHHISTMGATFKEYINQLRSNDRHAFPGRDHLSNQYPPSSGKMLATKLIMHIDMDCFFVSVGLRDKPHLVGKPVAVTHSKSGAGNARDGVNLLQEIESYRNRLGYGPSGSSAWSESKFSTTASMAEIASCSYEARKCGIKNGMFVGQALKLCPQLQFIHYDFDAYKQVSYQLYDSVARYTLDIEAVSCDEMYVDLTNLFQAIDLAPMKFAAILRKEILEKTGCNSSVGFGSNKLIARLATKKAKPNGQYWIEDDQIELFLNDLPLSELPGVGRSTTHKLKELAIKTCGDLQLLPLQELQKEFGKKHGETLYNACRGKEEKGLVFTHVKKSVSTDVNYGIRLRNDEERDIFLMNLTKETAKRLAAINMKGKCVTLKLMVRSKDAPEESAKYMGHGVCDHITKSVSLLSAISSTDDIYREVQKIIKPLGLDSKELRGVGIQVSRLESNAPVKNRLKDLFAANSKPSTTKDIVQKSPPPIAVEKDGKSTSVTKKSDVNIDKVPHKETSHSKDPKIEQPKTDPEGSSVQESYLLPADLRAMIGKWVEAEETPKRRDQRIILGYLLHLCKAQQIEDVFIILKAFYLYVKRRRKMQADWTQAYQKILESVQASMVAEYGGKLSMEEYRFL